ncbi:hypothetical protein NEUTE2DRAFT_130284 [Neurospora tetrasperma FGSC 2509]|nr:hypothetical protein NEUTE2DRAFT_130284 [Neurospora tetrasperma FGSC 2509]
MAITTSSENKILRLDLAHCRLLLSTNVCRDILTPLHVTNTTTSHLDPDTTQHIHPLPGANDDPPPAAALPKGSAWNTDLRTEPPSINVRAAWSWRTREEPHTLPSGYEKVAEAVYSVYPKKDMSDSAQTAVNLGSGLIAGFAAAIVSQPADTMLSKT